MIYSPKRLDWQSNDAAGIKMNGELVLSCLCHNQANAVPVFLQLIHQLYQLIRIARSQVMVGSWAEYSALLQQYMHTYMHAYMHNFLK